MAAKTFGEILEPVLGAIESDFPPEQHNDLKIIAYMAALTTSMEVRTTIEEEQ